MGGLFASIYTLMGRGMFVLLPPFSARGYIEAVVRYRCTSLSCVPAMMALIARERALLSQVDLRHVRDVHVGSAPLTDALVRKIREMFPEASVHNGYGSTEAGFGVFGPHPDGIATPTLSVGYPLRGVETHLVGCDDEGVLEVRSPAVMAGYQNLPEETAARMHDGWFNTGDIMRRDRDGFYFFVGRADDMFVCGGENIYPAMVESQLERHPAVLQACVVPVPDDIKGQVPVAFVVSRPNMHVDPEEVKQFALRHGPAYAHPRHIEVLQELPLQGTNKVDRRTLSKRAQETRLNREQVG
jgi:acyl-CoA synthetase (AMP-forming)/AMP-acid ligase II